MKNLIASSMILACIAGGVTACNTAKSKGPYASGHDAYTHEQYPQIEGLARLGNFMVHGDPIVTYEKNQAMTVSVPVRVLRERDVRAQYRFVFFDERDRPLEPQMDWQYAELPGRTQTVLTATSLQPEASDWRLQVRPTR
jgi:uncharacterized protein YcfL